MEGSVSIYCSVCNKASVHAGYCIDSCGVTYLLWKCVIVVVSWFRLVFILLGLLVVFASVFVFWQWCLWLLKVRGCCL